MKVQMKYVLLSILLIAGCGVERPETPDIKRAREVYKRMMESDGILVVTNTCFGRYLPFMWTADEYDWPGYPYCWDPGKPWVPFDFNFDGVVNKVDLQEAMGLCYSGPAVPYECMKNGHHIQCYMADIDQDGDVDQVDFGLIQAEVTR